ncbi:MAG: adenosylcobalamin-dependent ribonucleoside-diphosphate reductase [Candidatus Woesearchaeota archaeon]
MVENLQLEKKLEYNVLERKIYTNAEAVSTSSEYFNGDEMAARNFINKYALKDSDDNIYENSPVQMHTRLAKELSRIENKYENALSQEEIFSLIDHFKYIIPQGSPMAGIGNDYQITSLSNCFVIGSNGPSDSYGAILNVDQEQVQLMKRRGGVGHDLSHIRPKGTAVMNSALTSTGIVPFMERYSNSTREVAQDGRRGALMLSVSIRHPDAEGFIDAKLTEGKVTGANISVKIHDDFMEAVEANKEYVQQYPINSSNPKNKQTIDAKSLWNKIIHNAWKSAEPGVLFWDTIIKESIPDRYSDLGYGTVSTNPCGEIPLCPYDSCRLLAINLFSYVKNPFTKDAEFDFDLYKKHIKYAQRLSDDIIDLEIEKIDGILKKIESDPEDEKLRRVEKELWENIKHKAKEGRRHGLGITGEGDMLAALGLTYASDEAIDFSVKVQKTLAIEAYRSSVQLAKERGSFEIYDAKREEDNPFIQRIKEADPTLYEDMIKYGRRNIALLTIAPTGTVSIMTQTTSGIEPVFAPVYTRKRKVNPNDKDVKITDTDDTGDAWERYNVYHHKFEDWLKINGYNPEEVRTYSEDKLEELVKQSPYYKATANDVDWVQKVKMQGAMQKWVDHSISVTINLPKDVDEELVGKLYLTAWKSGCKGVTVYRDGSRDGVLSTGKDNTKKPFPKKRPESLDAEVLRFNNEHEKWIAFVGLYDNRPREIFTGKNDEEVLAVPTSIHKGQIVKKVAEIEPGKKESYYDFHFQTKRGRTAVVPGISDQFNREYWNYSRMLSGMLKNDVPLINVLDILEKLDVGSEGINSWRNGAIRALSKYVPDGTTTESACPNCGVKFRYQEGCRKCDCSSKCG